MPELVATLALLVMLGFFFNSRVEKRQRDRVNAARAAAHPDAGVLPGDDLTTIQAKTHAYLLAVDFASFVDRLLADDDVVPLFRDSQRAKAEALMERYHSHLNPSTK